MRRSPNPHRERHKVNKEISPTTGVLTLTGPETITTYPITGIGYKLQGSDMVDTRGFKQNDSNPCYHFKYFAQELLPLRTISWTDDHGDSYLEDTASNDIGLMPPDISEIVSLLYPPGFDQWLEDFAAQSVHHFVTAVDDDVSLLNFLIELIELCEGNVLKLKELGEMILKAIKTFRDMYKKTGNYWLSWNFAIKPTIKDVKAILNGLSNSMKRLDWLRKRNHLDTKVKYGQGPRDYSGTILITDGIQYPKIPIGPGPIYPDMPVPNDFGVWLEVEYEHSIKLTSNGWVRFDIPDYFLEGPEGLGIVWSALNGLYNPLKVAWEAVPFSWLIDWFVDMKTRLQLEAASLSPLKDAALGNTCWALKSNITCKLTWHYISYETEYVKECGEFTAILYNRQPGLPDEAGSPFRIPLEWYNISIIAALIQGKRRR